jgi:poly-beta-1,6-N-acetyl-D-glucosamine synthase
MEHRLLVVSPIRNEATHFERVARAMAEQTRKPDVWLVVDDQSSDETPRILAKLERELDFMSVIKTQRRSGQAAPKDRLAAAAPPKALNAGFESANWRSFTHLAKLDGDIELPPRYFELLLGEFAHDPKLGLAGGVLQERDGDGWSSSPTGSDYHIRGGLKCYSCECLEAIGGIQECLGWDAIDELYARMRGYKTRTFPELVARHYRQTGSADGALRGRARHGLCAYILHYPLPWVTLRAFKVARERPRAISGVAFLYGYVRAALTRAPQVDDPEFRRFVRRELRQRARGEIVQRITLQRGEVPLVGHEH